MAGKNEKVNEAAERLARTTYGSYRTGVDRAVGMQERNVRLAQGLVQGSIRGLRRQSERNWEMAEEFLERSEEHGHALRTLLEESMVAYVDLLYAPLSHHEEGPEAAKKAPTR